MGRALSISLAGACTLALAAGCVGTIPKEALDARASQLSACAERDVGERPACYAALTPMRDDEPREGDCKGFVEYIRWATEAAPDCVTQLEEDDRLGRGPVCSEARPPGLALAKQGRAWCEERIARLDKAFACLRSWTPPYENVRGASASCYVKIAGERKIAAARLAEIQRIIDELEPPSSSAPPPSSSSEPPSSSAPSPE